MGGARYRLPLHVQQSVMEHIAAGRGDTEIWQNTGVHRHTVAKWRLSLEYWGQCYPPPIVKLGRPTLLRQEQPDGLTQHLHDEPHAYLEEMQDSLYHKYNIEASISTVWRALEKMKYTRKLATKRAKEQPLRRAYRARMAQ